MSPAPVLDGFLAMEVLSPPQLKRLKEHKYSAEGKSITEPVMQVFWCWLVEQVPRTLAPNTITLVGLAANIISTLILVFYCPTATEVAPGWAYAFAAVCLFAYQSLDAIDGKQARRTNSSTQLGELFDHGCDAVSIGKYLVLIQASSRQEKMNCLKHRRNKHLCVKDGKSQYFGGFENVAGHIRVCYMYAYSLIYEL